MTHEAPKLDTNGRFLGASKAARDVRRRVRLAAGSDCTVLVTGESGVGKELVARDIHEASDRAREPFVAMNCAAITEGIIDSELFGHEGGSFTGARGTHVGAFERANGGTLFLDEVGDLSSVAQPKLLRALDRSEVVRVGGEATLKLDVRVVAATNQDLRLLCSRGTFREDLFYRLGVIEILIPPLRERRDDIGTLASHFSHRFAEKLRREPVRFLPEAIDHLTRFQWPGNVRQLRSAIERAMVMFPEPVLGPSNFELGANSAGVRTVEDLLHRDWRDAREGFERLYVRRLLVRHAGHVEAAAEEAGLAVGSLYKIIRRLGLRRTSDEAAPMAAPRRWE